jgi:transcriptional regulator with XRE-family HTH domain
MAVRPDPSPPALAVRGWRGGPRERTAWLLRSHRLHGADGRWVTGSRFASAFRGGSWAATVSESTVSRWETGAVRPTHAVVRRYEELLEVEPASLSAMIDTIHRYAGSATGAASALRRDVPDGAAREDRLDDLVDRALSDADMTGAQWDELTTLLVAPPRVLLVPTSSWARLAERLVSEMIIASWTSWMHRFESLSRLLAHAPAERAAIAACASLAADPSNRIVVELVCALDSSDHPDAARHVIAQLTDPTSERARFGALLACIRKSRRRHFSPDQLLALGIVIADLAADPGQQPSVRPLAVEVLRQNADHLTPALRARLRVAASHSPSLGSVLNGGRLVGDRTALLGSGRMASATLAAMPHETPPDAAVALRTMLDEVLYSPVPDVRLFSAMLLAASPFRTAVAAALAGDLRTPSVLADQDRLHAVLGGLRVLGDQAERPEVERLVTAYGQPTHVPALAVYALGHMGGTSDDTFWRGALDHHGRAWRRHARADSAQVLEGLVYGLGIARHHDLLTEVRQDPRSPAPARRSATWWLDLPRSVAHSADL